MWTSLFGVEIWLHKTLFLSDPLADTCLCRRHVWRCGFVSPDVNLRAGSVYGPLTHFYREARLHSLCAGERRMVAWQAIQPWGSCLIWGMSLRLLTTHSSPMKMGVKILNLTWFLWELDKTIYSAQDRCFFTSSACLYFSYSLLLLNLVLFLLKFLFWNISKLSTNRSNEINTHTSFTYHLSLFIPLYLPYHLSLKNKGIPFHGTAITLWWLHTNTIVQ